MTFKATGKVLQMIFNDSMFIYMVTQMGSRSLRRRSRLLNTIQDHYDDIQGHWDNVQVPSDDIYHLHVNTRDYSDVINVYLDSIQVHCILRKTTRMTFQVIQMSSRSLRRRSRSLD